MTIILFFSLTQWQSARANVMANQTSLIKSPFKWSGGPRSSMVGFFCFVSRRAWKQKKPTPLDRGPLLDVNRPLDTYDFKLKKVKSDKGRLFRPVENHLLATCNRWEHRTCLNSFRRNTPHFIEKTLRLHLTVNPLNPNIKIQGCTLREIEGSPVLWICKI